ncbi:Spherulation-specific family 4-domain-containing protein [Mycena rebaudengoi]|nr:Spherulation-specific family 4-domain-containing protein [Mycena rebaudengoi]
MLSRTVLVALLFRLSLVSCIQALAVLLPLNIDPGSNCNAWSSVSAAVSAHPNTQFYIVISPGNGPGSGDSDYAACVETLRPFSNVILLGYVIVGSSTLSDIDKYADIYRPAGIYLDGTPAEAGGVSTVKNYVSHARSKGFNFNALGPGESVDAAYYPLVDLITTYESSYSSFSVGSLSSASSTPRSKQTVILTDAPASGSYSSVISQLQDVGVAAIYITDASISSQDIPRQLSAWVSDVASVSGGSTTPSTSPPERSSSNPAANPSNSPTQQNFSSHHSPPIGAIVGGILGALVIIMCLVTILLRLRSRRRRMELAEPHAFRVAAEDQTTQIPIRAKTATAPISEGRSDPILPTPTQPEPGSTTTAGPTSDATVHALTDYSGTSFGAADAPPAYPGRTSTV